MFQLNNTHLSSNYIDECDQCWILFAPDSGRDEAGGVIYNLPWF